MSKSPKLPAVIATAALLALSLQAAHANRYMIEDLGANVVGFAINDQGYIAGSKNESAIEFRTGRQDVLKFRDRGGAAVGINARGDAVGSLGVTPILWARFGHRSVIPLPGGATIGDASGVADDGTTAGTYVLPEDPEHEHCFRTLPDGTSVDLGLLEEGDTCVPAAIDSSGQRVVGTANVGAQPFGDAHAFLWRDGVLQDLGTLGGRNSNANAINAAGEIVGRATRPGNVSRAFLWRDGEMRDIGNSPRYSATEANAISDRGDIVGSGFLAKNNRLLALRFADGAVVALEDEVENLDDWVLFTANAVNNGGLILGRGFRRDDNRSHGFLLRPLP